MPPETREHRPRKRFGQHFLVDAWVIDRIIELIAPAAGEHILEIGPGEGVLTAPLLAAGVHLEAVEIDRDLARDLAVRFSGYPHFALHNEDVLGFDFSRLAGVAPRWKIVGNLPYNISTPLIMRLLEQADQFSEMTFMLQREVAERLSATPGTRARGRLGVMAQRCAVIHERLAVPADSFEPPPRVESSVVQLVPRGDVRDPVLEARVAEIVRMAFSARRKTLANALRRSVTPAVLQACGIDPGARAETLTTTEFECLARASLAADR